MNEPHVARAVAALTGKAQRLRASAASQPRDAARKRELADGLERLAALAAQGPSEVRRLLDQPRGQGISPDARKHAGNEIYALALQRESQGTERNVRAPMRAGWERGGDDLGLPIHRATLQEAVELLALAEAVHPEPFGTWTRAGLLEWLGDYALAAEVYANADGAYARHAPECVARCRAKAAGTYDPVAPRISRRWPARSRIACAGTWRAAAGWKGRANRPSSQTALRTTTAWTRCG